MKKQNLIGQKFGFLEVIGEAPNLGVKTASLCRCVCGVERTFRNNALTHIKHPVKSCGCKTKEFITESNSRDLTTEKFSSLQPIEVVGRKNGHLVWKCKCDCGNFKDCSSSDLVQGSVTGCGLCKRSTLPRDLTGQKFGKLTVLERDGKLNSNKTAWRCQCSCGTIKTMKQNSLVSGCANSCGCEINYNKVNLIGKQFGRLTAVSILGSEEGIRYYLCKCSCGQETAVSTSCLNNGNTKSCGCLQKEIFSKITSAQVREKSPNWKGGVAIDYDDRRTKEYAHWRSQVYARGNDTCVICGETKKIEAHHLNSFLKFKDQRFLPENGVCLCHFCHKLFHAEYGSGDNTKEQFEEFRVKLGV